MRWMVENWVESINKESDWEDWDERGKLWGNECYEWSWDIFKKEINIIRYERKRNDDW